MARIYQLCACGCGRPASTGWEYEKKNYASYDCKLGEILKKHTSSPRHIFDENELAKLVNLKERRPSKKELTGSNLPKKIFRIGDKIFVPTEEGLLATTPKEIYSWLPHVGSIIARNSQLDYRIFNPGARKVLYREFYPNSPAYPYSRHLLTVHNHVHFIPGGDLGYGGENGWPVEIEIVQGEAQYEKNADGIHIEAITTPAVVRAIKKGCERVVVFLSPELAHQKQKDKYPFDDRLEEEIPDIYASRSNGQFSLVACERFISDGKMSVELINEEALKLTGSSILDFSIIEDQNRLRHDEYLVKIYRKTIGGHINDILKFLWPQRAILIGCQAVIENIELVKKHVPVGEGIFSLTSTTSAGGWQNNFQRVKDDCWEIGANDEWARSCYFICVCVPHERAMQERIVPCRAGINSHYSSNW